MSLMLKTDARRLKRIEKVYFRLYDAIEVVKWPTFYFCLIFICPTECVWLHIIYVCVSVTQPCPTICDPMNCVAHQALLSMEFSRQEYWCDLPFPSSGDLPDSGIEPGSPTLQADSLLSEPPGKPIYNIYDIYDISSNIYLITKLIYVILGYIITYRLTRFDSMSYRSSCILHDI